MSKRLGVAPAILLALFLGCAAPTGAPAGAAARPLEVESTAVSPPGVTVARLSNGLTLIVSENHAAPVVCVQSAVRAGSLYEGKYLDAGISHLLEHLVAEGAEHTTPGGGAQTPAKSKSTRVDRIGGQSNAFTSMDDTNYYIAATAGQTDACIDLVADWMARARITPEDFQREHGVVQRELEMGRDNPSRQLSYAHMRNVYGTHPAAVPVIGDQPPLARLTRQDVLDYHARMYVPQNMVLAVVGDVDPEQVLTRVRRAFAGFAPDRQPELSLPEVGPISTVRRVTLSHKAVTEVHENFSFLTVPLQHEDLYALDVLDYVLTQGDSSRLQENIKRKAGLVTAIGSSSWTPAWGKGQFTFSFRAAPDKADAAERGILDELRKVIAQGVAPEELERAKRQKVADLVYAQQTMESQAGTLISDFLSTGDVGFSRRYTDRIQKVTAGQVQAAAKKYFDFDRMVVTRMTPAGTPATQAAATQPAGQARAVTFTLPNGLRVVLTPTPSVDLVSMVLVSRGGLLLETPQTNGLGALMAMLATRGAGDRSAEQIDEFFDNAGGSLSGRCGNNTCYWEATLLADHFDQALPIFADVVVRPTYPQKELDISRPILLAQIAQVGEDWQSLLNRHFRRDFFGDSPLSMLTIGDAAVVDKATPKAIAEAHARWVRAGSSVLSIHGRFDPAKTRPQLEKLFTDMPQGEAPLPEIAPRKLAGDETFTHAGKVKGAGVIVAAQGMKLTNLDDTLPMAVLDTIISGYQLPRGWLHDDLRGRSLVYVVHAYNFAALAPGAFVVYAHTEPDKVQDVVGIIRADLAKTRRYAFTPAEIDEAVNIILTAELLDNQQVSALAMQAALDELYGFGYDFRRRSFEQRLRAVKPADLTRVAEKYFAPGLVTVVLKPEGPAQTATAPAKGK